MPPRKSSIALISASDILWESCGTIIANLRTAYQDLASEYLLHDLRLDRIELRNDVMVGNGAFLKAANSIYEKGVKKVVFLDPPKNIDAFLMALKCVDAGQAANLHYYFHVYGDFTVYAEAWKDLGAELEGYPARLFCASDRQSQLVRSFEREPSLSATEVCPFAVDADFFSFSQDDRESWRKRLGIGKRHLALYSGRLSLQKGLLSTVREFEWQLNQGIDAELVLAGSFDDIGGPSTGLKLQHGYYSHRFQEMLAALSPNIRSRIRHLGNLDHKDLKGLYSAADSFISLSLYHDEDFGMAPAEALASGLPSVLSDWGGYSSFAMPGASVHLISVALNSRGLSLDFASLRKIWSQVLVSETSLDQRISAGMAFASRFSPSAVADHLAASLRRPLVPFRGFNWRLAGLKSPNNFREGLYKEIYGHYVSPGV